MNLCEDHLSLLYIDNTKKEWTTEDITFQSFM